MLSVFLMLAIDCACDPAKPASMETRQCSLCREAEKQPANVGVFFLKDINPRKPNRWLALPRAHGGGQHHLHEMTKAHRTELWTAAIAKAKELFGPDDWGLAYNGEKVRTQCHTHLHMGRWVKQAEQAKGFIVVSGPAEIPAPPGAGIWVHPVGNKLHVHVGEQITETVLVR
jgi:diadenosine tetraphosphate (Ap4A) HIT family hydrolase